MDSRHGRYYIKQNSDASTRSFQKKIKKSVRMTGVMRPKPKKMKRSKRKSPYRSRRYLISSAPRGSSENSTLEPSSGGMGTQLNMPRRILMKMTWEIKKPKDESGVAKAALAIEGTNVAPVMAIC